ncbi:MAG TPA: tetratricopeptide repeat protein, partial [Rhodothermales bacterium]|nr:tetratricopeptide repeat protein [Rhodothermales bacterium]
RFDAAEAAYGRARTAAPAGQGADYALYQTAQAQAEAGRPEEALATLDRLLAEYPRSTLRPDALYARGYVRFNTGDFDGAITEYQRVLDEHPSSPTAAKALYAIGDAHFNAGRTREAETAYRGVLERYPSSPFVANALEGLDVALTEQGRRGEFAAAAAAAEARVADPAARDRLRLRRAELDVAAGDFAAAEPVLATLASGAADPDVRPRALHALGAALVGQERPGEAADAYGRLVSTYGGHPLQADAAVRRGEALLADGQAARAAQVMADFERLFPDDTELVAAALWVQSRALAEAGREAEAADARARLLDRFPDSAAAADARAAGGN